MSDARHLTVRESLGAPSVALLGHSWGGLVALEYTARWPERVSHLVRLNSAPATHHDFMAFLREHLGAATADGRDVGKLIPRLLGGATSADILRARAIDARLAEATWRQSDYDVLARLPASPPPILVIHGERDLVPLAAVRAIADRVRGARCERARPPPVPLGRRPTALPR